MNQGWKVHNIEYAMSNKWIDYYLEASITKKIKTKNYDCNVSNNMQMTKCLNEVYMSKLNCSFPWLKYPFGTLEKCGNKHYIDDLKDLIDHVVNSDGILADAEKCIIPNCVTTKWNTKKHTFDFNGSWHTTFIDSDLKVRNQPIDTYFYKFLESYFSKNQSIHTQSSLTGSSNGGIISLYIN